MHERASSPKRERRRYDSVSEGREARRPCSKSSVKKSLIANDEHQPRRALHAHKNFPVRRGEREEEGKQKIPGNG